MQKRNWTNQTDWCLIGLGLYRSDWTVNTNELEFE